MWADAEVIGHARSPRRRGRHRRHQWPRPWPAPTRSPVLIAVTDATTGSLPCSPGRVCSEMPGAHRSLSISTAPSSSRRPRPRRRRARGDARGLRRRGDAGFLGRGGRPHRHQDRAKPLATQRGDGPALPGGPRWLPRRLGRGVRAAVPRRFERVRRARRDRGSRRALSARDGTLPAELNGKLEPIARRKRARGGPLLRATGSAASAQTPRAASTCRRSPGAGRAGGRARTRAYRRHAA
jgi:hypothetical protein